MARLGNKGQSLTLFIVFIPFIIILGIYLLDISYTKYNLNKLNLINKDIIKYGLKNINNDPKKEMERLIKLNDSEISKFEININSEDKIISSYLEKKTNGFFGNILQKRKYKEKSKLIGRIIDDKIIIEGDD